jgi:ferredoxin
MSWKIDIDSKTCLGSGMCAGARPDLFTLNAAYAETLVTTVDPDEGLLDVADSCPAAAIVVTDETGKELAPRD